jgi:PAS domain S-box-containing protein
MSSDSRNGGITGNGAGKERALRASELSYRRVFEAAQDGILILDVDTGRITDVNPFLIKLLGFSHSEMVGQTVGELSPFKDLVSNQAMLEQLQLNGYVRYEDLPLETRDGRKIAVEFVSNVYQAGDKKVIQCNIRDITERKRRERELEQKIAELATRNEELLLSKKQLLLRSTAIQSIALETAANSVVITDIKGNILWVNPAFTTLTGYSSEEVIGKNPRLLKSGKHGREYYKKLWETILAGKTWRGAFTDRRKDGTLYYDEHTITPVRSKEGIITHFVAIMNDMTERRQAEEALRESEVKFRALFEAANDAIFILHNGVFVDCNAKGLELFGVTRDQFIGQSPARFSPPTQPDGRDSQEKMKEIVERAMAGEPQFFEWVHLRPDGRQVYSEVSLSRLDLHGEPYLQAIARDITERKKAELALAESQSRHRLLVENMLGGYAYCRVLFEQDRARDFIYLEVNNAFEALTGLKDVVGKKASEIMPGIQETNPELFEIYGRVALTGKPERFETHVKPLGKWFSISVYSHEKAHFIAIVENITERKQAEEQILLKNAFLEAQVNSSLDGKLIVDNEEKKLLQNQRMVDLWNIPQEIADEVDDRRELKLVTSKVKNP